LIPINKNQKSHAMRARGYRLAFRHPAARASASEQNQRSPLAVLIDVRS